MPASDEIAHESQAPGPGSEAHDCRASRSAGTPDATEHDLRLIVRDLGRLAYADALAIQRETHQRVLDGNSPMTLLLVEHDPVITVSRRRGSADHLIADQATLDRLGIAVQVTDRGGDITYHGPGQLVAYPIFRLNPLRLNIGRYMRQLEQVAIETAAAFDVAAQRVEGKTGVWVAGKGGTCDSQLDAKLCAIGVRVRRMVTLHGLALNVTTDLSHFNTIVPCGLHGTAVTSLAKQLGEAAPPLDDVKPVMIDAVARTFGLSRIDCEQVTP